MRARGKRIKTCSAVLQGNDKGSIELQMNMPDGIGKHVFGLLITCFLLMSSTLGQATIEIELENGGFEAWSEGILTGWSTSPAESAIQDRDLKYEGSSSLLVKLTPEFGNVAVVQEGKIAVKHDNIYEVSFFYKKDAHCSLGIYIRNYEQGEEDAYKDQELFTDWQQAEDWNQKTICFLPYPNTEEISIKFSCSGQGNAWIDGVRLREIEKKGAEEIDTKELLANPGFESYTEEDEIEDKEILGNWRKGGHGPATVTIIIDPGRAHSGEKFIRVKQEKEAHGVVYQQGIPVNFLNKYRFSVWAKGEGTVTLAVYQTGERAGRQVLGEFDLTEDWRHYSCIYVPSSSAVTYAHPALNVEGYAYYDDVSFMQVK